MRKPILLYVMGNKKLFVWRSCYSFGFTRMKEFENKGFFRIVQEISELDVLASFVGSSGFLNPRA